MDRVLIVDAIDDEAEAILSRVAELVRAPDSAPGTIRRLARDVDGILTRSKLPDDVFDHAPNLRAVAIHGTGTDLVPLAAATARGAMVSNVPGGNAQSVAEYCAMAMLVLARNAIGIVSRLKSSSWDAARALGAGTHELAGMTLGIVGVGHIGQRLAKICRDGFGMTVLGHQRRLDPAAGRARHARRAARAQRLRGRRLPAHARDASPLQRGTHRPDETHRLAGQRRPRARRRGTSAGRSAARETHRRGDARRLRTLPPRARPSPALAR
jgi:phosphoglycerate dehydrogenase-like enzyme